MLFNCYVSAWNSRPSVIVNSKSVAQFCVLLSFDLSLFLNYAFLYFYLTVMLCVHLCIHLRVIFDTGITLTVLYPVITNECASFTSQLLINVFIASLLNC